MILLDTHTLLWLKLGSDKLGIKTRKLINQAWSDNAVYVSVITFWEISMLVNKGKIKLFKDLNVWAQKSLDQGLKPISINSKIAIRAGSLRDLHGDPADRIIVATALEGYRLVTADRQILNWSGQLNRLNAKT